MSETIGQVDNKALLAALRHLKKGDFSVRLPIEETVVGAAIAEAFNELARPAGDRHPGDGPDRHGRRQRRVASPSGPTSGPPPGPGLTESSRSTPSRATW